MSILDRSTPQWTTRGPASWPDAPADMTVSTLIDIEGCPRRWALTSAAYPHLWNDRGYPPRLQIKALAGSVVHLALETITKEVAQAGCPSVQDASAVAVLQRLGGLSRVVNQSIDRMLERVAANPRARHLLEHVGRSLRAQAPDLRGHVQSVLCRRHLPRRPNPGPISGAKHRARLASGIYCELELRAAALRWKGKADLLALSDDVCEITDFKTGEPSDKHHFQIRTYAFLWSRDVDLNPDQRRASRLILAYPSGDNDVQSPDCEELVELGQQLASRGAAARQAVSRRPPEAMPEAQQCRYCGVRHLCDTYWLTETQRALASQMVPQSFGDIEVTILGRHGPSSWDIGTNVPAETTQPGRGLLRTNGNIEFRAGDSLRILDAAITGKDDAGGPLVVTLGVLSETFRRDPA
jgi:hypothetical protein